MKYKCKKIILFFLSSAGIVFVVYYLGVTAFLSNWTDWSEYERFTTINGDYSIIINVSYPPTPATEIARFQIICRNEMNNKEKVFSTFKSMISTEETQWFEFKERNVEEAILIVNIDHDNEIEINWSDVFN